MDQQLGRLAMREEGGFWSAYYAMPGSMEGAVLLGTIRMRFVARPERKVEFMAMMREAVGDILEGITGARPVWPDPDGQRAPERERAGRA